MQVRTIGASALRRVGILRKTISVFGDVAVVSKCFWAFILPVLEYCSLLWMSAATSHLLLLDRVIGRVSQLSGGSVNCDFWHRCIVESLCVFFKYDSLVDHPVRGFFPAQCVLRRPTHGALAAHSRSFEMPRFRTGQFSRSFVPSCIRLWNGLLDLSLLVKVWVSQLLSFTIVTAHCFFLFFDYFSSLFHFLGT